MRHVVRGGRGAFSAALCDVVKDVSLSRPLSIAEQLSQRFCTLRMFHPRKVLGALRDFHC